VKQKHNTLSSLYQEWYGLGEYNDSYGGVEGQNKTNGAAWRKHINRQHYFRVKRIVAAIDTEKYRTGTEWAEVVEILEPTFDEANKSLAKMVDKLKDKGLVTNCRKRKAAKVSDG
jgi:Transcriptional activator of glycolytic enzymes